MTTEIKKYVPLYKVFLKDGDTIIITEGQFKFLEKKLNETNFVNLGGELFNKFEIVKIKKHKLEESVITRLNQEPESVKIKVKEYKRLYKKEITLKVIENMIHKAKTELLQDQKAESFIKRQKK